MDPIETLERSLDTAGDVLAAIPADKLDAPTACPAYDVRALTQHLVVSLAYFATSATGEESAVEMGDDPKAAFDEAAAKLTGAWKQPGMLDKTFTLPFGDFPGSAIVAMGAMEALTHAWDLARATGQSTAFPEDLSGEVLAIAQGMLQPHFRGEGPDASFGPEREAPADAHAADRLAAFMGRDPQG
ncbi:MAG TPA: TIGR03086 family metal-binding protein [Acidimicrobiales bacterium]|nr:TIGR03086 family metal-binding protein [Acidimicrobiales bacterium]